MPRSLMLAIALLALSGPAPRIAHAADAPGPRLALRGVVSLPSGAPVSRARVSAMARGADGGVLGPARGFSATTDDSGRFALELPLPDRAGVRRRGYELDLWVAARAMHFLALDGQASLGLDLHLETLPDGTARVVAAANDARLAALAARAVATDTRVEMTGVAFTGVMGELTREPAMPRRPEVARVAVSAAPADAAPPARPATRMLPMPPAAADSYRVDVTPGSARGTRQPARAASPTRRAASDARRDSTRRARRSGAPTAAVPAPLTHPPATPEPARPASPPDSSGCEGRVVGTVEATAGDPLPEPLRVAVWIDGAPALSDTVTLDMGSPRPFALEGVPCGVRRLVVRALGERARYAVRDPEHALWVRCRRERAAQTRIELIPR